MSTASTSCASSASRPTAPRLAGLILGFLSSCLFPLACGQADRAAADKQVTRTASALTTTLVARGAVWRYLDNGSNQGTAWKEPAFNDASWAQGAAELGYGDGDEATTVRCTSDSVCPTTAANKFITTYLRRSFNVANPNAFSELTLSLLRDDGAVVYLNGTEVHRDNLPAGPVTFQTEAVATIGGAAEDAFNSVSLPVSSLVAGTNVIAVEIHQDAPTSSDISFNLELTASDDVAVTRGPYLHGGAPGSAIVRWRTTTTNVGAVRYGTAMGALNSTAVESIGRSEHIVTLTGLQPGTKYFYSVGTNTTPLKGGDVNTFFVTPPVVGTAKPTRIWALGDSGTATANAARVRDAYANYAGTRTADVLLFLGDNAYAAGTDAEFQTAVFDFYPRFLAQTFLWPTIGNHDTAQSSNPPDTIPYFNIYSFPQNGEAGGLASGTKRYYAFDQANIHFLCLDSMTSSRAAGSQMLSWLDRDLAANTRDWIVAFWHHPPYSKGSHNSDTEVELREMRQNALPILEKYGVDLVLTGHSHDYERTFFINGHFGASSTWNNSLKVQDGSGRASDPSGAYRKTQGQMGKGAVYVVTGSAGQVANGLALDHPAMFVDFAELGSLVVDVDGGRLDARFLRDTGVVADEFTILKGAPNNLPVVTITEPAGNATFASGANVTIRATATDQGGTVQSVAFYRGSTLIGTDSAAPWEVTWMGATEGTHQLTARATDDQNASNTSASVTIVVNPPPPVAPTMLTATAIGSSQIDLAWTDASTNELNFKIERSTDNVTFAQTGQVGAGVRVFSATGLAADTTYYFRVRASNAGGDSAYSNVAMAKTGLATMCLTMELCNDKDDTCNAMVDEGFDKGAACTAGRGECTRAGVKICAQDGRSTVCDATPGAATAELCDGKDNDCNGEIDELFPDRGAACTVGSGECTRTGVRMCNPTNMTSTMCSVEPGTPSPEICDGKDNDCDDQIDEDVGGGMSCTVGVGECARTGRVSCASGGGTMCSVVAGPPSLEICDDKDNDCNGTVDDGFQKGFDCTAGVGECARPGKLICAGNGVNLACNAVAGGPVAEICGDLKDNDCNGLVDDDCVDAGAGGQVDAPSDVASSNTPDMAPLVPSDVAPMSTDRGTPSQSDGRSSESPEAARATDGALPGSDGGRAADVASSVDAVTSPPLTSAGDARPDLISTTAPARLDGGTGDTRRSDATVGGPSKPTASGCSCAIGASVGEPGTGAASPGALGLALLLGGFLGRRVARRRPRA